MSRYDDALNYALNALKKSEVKNSIHAVYLYGSCARGEQKLGSDIDLYVELNEDVSPKLKRQLKVACNPDDWTLPDVDVKIGLSLEDAPDNDLFYRNIRRDGVIIWKR